MHSTQKEPKTTLGKAKAELQFLLKENSNTKLSKERKEWNSKAAKQLEKAIKNFEKAKKILAETTQESTVTIFR